MNYRYRITYRSRKALFGGLLVFGISLFFTAAPADGRIPGSMATDSLDITLKIKEYTRYFEAGEFQKAYKPWTEVFGHAPLVTEVKLCADGTKILHALMAYEKDSTVQKNYFNKLIALYDWQTEHLDTLNALTGLSLTKEYILGKKAHDYILFANNRMNVDSVYKMINEALPSVKEASDCHVLQDLVDISFRKFRKDNTGKEQFIMDYLLASDRLNELEVSATEEKDKRLIKVTRNTVDARFIKSGMAGCENLENVLGPEVERHRQDLNYLKQITTIMKKLRCTNENAYFAASEFAHAIEPTAETALGCAYLYYKKNDIEQSLHFFDEAIDLEKDVKAKAENCYAASIMLYSKKQLSKAREYARKAIGLNPNIGKAYLLIAQMYASSPNWSDEATLNKCTYYAIIEKLQQAKSVDPSITEEAQKLITTYAGQLPKEEDLFFLGLKKGNTVNIGGWIGEKATIK